LNHLTSLNQAQKAESSTPKPISNHSLISSLLNPALIHASLNSSSLNSPLITHHSQFSGNKSSK
ncbi:13318_t:CDS:1, partial [Funneliformis geosporum]